MYCWKERREKNVTSRFLTVLNGLLKSKSHLKEKVTPVFNTSYIPAWQSFLTMPNFALLSKPGALLRKVPPVLRITFVCTLQSGFSFCSPFFITQLAAILMKVMGSSQPWGSPNGYAPLAGSSHTQYFTAPVRLFVSAVPALCLLPRPANLWPSLCMKTNIWVATNTI